MNRVVELGLELKGALALSLGLVLLLGVVVLITST